MRRFGAGASGVVGASSNEAYPIDFIQGMTLQELREAIMRPAPPETISYFMDDTNWESELTAIYLLKIGTSETSDWSEVVLCQAANLYHAGQLWVSYCF